MQELLNTKKNICMAEGEFEVRMVRGAPEGSYLKAVHDVSKKNGNGRVCTLPTDPNEFVKQDLFKTLILLNDLNRYTAAFMMSNLAEVSVF